MLQRKIGEQGVVHGAQAVPREATRISQPSRAIKSLTVKLSPPTGTSKPPIPSMRGQRHKQPNRDGSVRFRESHFLDKCFLESLGFVQRNVPHFGQNLRVSAVVLLQAE